MSSFKVDRVLPAASWCAKDTSVNKRLSESLRKLKSAKDVKNSPTLLNGFDMSVTEQACLGILTGIGAQASAEGPIPEAVPVAETSDRVVDPADAGPFGRSVPDPTPGAGAFARPGGGDAQVRLAGEAAAHHPLMPVPKSAPRPEVSASSAPVTPNPSGLNRKQRAALARKGITIRGAEVCPPQDL